MTRRPRSLFIEPDECICCGLCLPECPVDAIFEDTDLPKEWAHFAEINAEFYRKHPFR